MLLSVPSPANGGGTGYAGAGSKGLGRAGAFAVKADDTTALLYNPANLAVMGGVQFGGGFQVVLAKSCFDRSGSYGDSALHEGSDVELTAPEYDSIYGSAADDTLMNTPFPKVCNNGAPGVIPDLGVTWRIHPKFGLGLGIVAPPGVATLKYGSRDLMNNKLGVVDIDGKRLPAPTRYMLVDMQQLFVFPSIGFGYSPSAQFRMGLTAGWGIASIKQNIISKPLQGEWFSTDTLTELKVKDVFLPRLTVSAVAVPIPSKLEAMLFFTWQDDVKANGSIDYTTGYYSTAEGGYIDKSKATNVKMTLPQPWQTGFGLRLIIPRENGEPAFMANKNEKKFNDGMVTEKADFELNVVYEMNSRVDGATIEQESLFSQGFIEPGELEAPGKVVQNFVWKDQVSLRLGSDINLIPNRLALRLGFHYETHGVTEGWEQLSVMPFQRVGFHAGTTLRVRRMDINLAYGCIYQVPVELAGGQAKQTQSVASEERGPGTIINQGRFTSVFHVISAGITFRRL